MRLFVLAITALAILAPSASAQEIDLDDADPTSLFFDGLGLMESGDCVGAIARFELALSRDPELHQARLYAAECFEQLELPERAVEEVRAYLAADFPGAEVDRAQELLVRCGRGAESESEAEAEAESESEGRLQRPTSPNPGPDSQSNLRRLQGDVQNRHQPPANSAAVPYRPPTAPVPSELLPKAPTTEPVAEIEIDQAPTGGAAARALVWSPLRLEGGGSVMHVANAVGLTAGGPLVELRVLPWRYLEAGVRIGMGFGTYPEDEGVILAPEIAFGASASIPVRRVRVVVGVAVPLIVSQYGGVSGVVAGVRAEGGVRFTPPGSRLVLGAQVEGGHVGRPTIGGSVRIGVQLGRRGDADAR